MPKRISISDLVLRDAHQSLHATRMTTADMLPACPMLDKIGYASLEAWGGATFDACIRFLNEDPWSRLRSLRDVLPHTPIMMLLRGQNLLGYRHYADDIVDRFVERAAENGVSVFRIFDALNDPRNLERAARAAKRTGKHVQMAIAYATTPYHTNVQFADLARYFADSGADSICIKDMAGLLKPFDAYDLVKAIKARVDLPVQVHTHATTGMSVATLLKAAEAGADTLDTVISSMAMGTSHSPTETIVEILKGTEMDTGLDIKALLEIAAYFREVRKRYARYESSFLGADTRILVSQVPGGMLSNLETQLKEQGASSRMDEVLAEIAEVQRDFGYIPLVTPTSQIVGTQAVFNVLFGRYEKLTQESKDLLTGKYGKTPAPCEPKLVAKALSESGMDASVDRRPADLLPMEFDRLDAEARANGSDGSVEDTLTYAMFPKVASSFFKERIKGPIREEGGQPAGVAISGKAPGPAPAATTGSAPGTSLGPWTVTVNGKAHAVRSEPKGDALELTVDGTSYSVSFSDVSTNRPATGKPTILCPVSGTVRRLLVAEGASVAVGESVMVVESMKMELNVKSSAAGAIRFLVAPGTSVLAGQPLAEIGQ